MHGVICETTKFSTIPISHHHMSSYKRLCDFDTDRGSFSYKSTNLNNEVKCSELFKTGF